MMMAPYFGAGKVSKELERCVSELGMYGSGRCERGHSGDIVSHHDEGFKRTDEKSHNRARESKDVGHVYAKWEVWVMARCFYHLLSASTIDRQAPDPGSRTDDRSPLSRSIKRHISHS